MVVISNNPEHRKPPRQLSKEEEEALIERLGGIEALKKSFADFREVTNRFDQDRKVLISQHPNKWVLMDKNGPLVFGDTFEEVREYARANGLGNPNVIAEYLDPDPPAMVL